jgi:Uma2 family endonuclease
MTTRTADYMEAIEHLPDGTMLVIPQSTWDEYERLLEDLAGWPGMRVTYDRGRLEVMSPSAEHEEYKEFILRIVHAACEALGLPLEARGSMTWNHRQNQQGTEPDTCFYIANAHRITGKRNIDLESDPPPDVAVEIDITNESLSKFPIYAAMLVPEIWRYDGTVARFYEQAAGRYREIGESRALPPLTAAMLTDALTRSKKDGQTAALAAFARRFRGGS